MAKHSANCPVCDQKAKRRATTTGDYAEIKCTKCGLFQISGTLQEIFSGYRKSVRRQSLDRAKLRAKYGALPLVTTYDLP